MTTYPANALRRSVVSAILAAVSVLGGHGTATSDALPDNGPLTEWIEALPLRCASVRECADQAERFGCQPILRLKLLICDGPTYRKELTKHRA